MKTSKHTKTKVTVKFELYNPTELPIVENVVRTISEITYAIYRMLGENILNFSIHATDEEVGVDNE